VGSGMSKAAYWKGAPKEDPVKGVFGVFGVFVESKSSKSSYSFQISSSKGGAFGNGSTAVVALALAKPELLEVADCSEFLRGGKVKNSPEPWNVLRGSEPLIAPWSLSSTGSDITETDPSFLAFTSSGLAISCS
jgi:hypothetical protein